jgi:hypothetical protein
MSDTAVHIELPAEALHGSNCEDIDPPVHVRTQVPHGAALPWYEKFLNRHFTRVDFVFVKINGVYYEASLTERRIVWAIETVVCAPVILSAMVFRAADRVLRRAGLLRPLLKTKIATPLDLTGLALLNAAMLHGELHVDQTGRIAVSQKRSAGPCLSTKFLPQIKRKVSEYAPEITTEASSGVGAGNWHVCFINGEGDAFTLKAQRMYSDY